LDCFGLHFWIAGFLGIAADEVGSCAAYFMMKTGCWRLLAAAVGHTAAPAQSAPTLQMTSGWAWQLAAGPPWLLPGGHRF